MTDLFVEVIPDPERVIEGLRDTGYQPETAIEDIIDNSIAADATCIKVDLLMDYYGDITVYVADNGCGMGKEDLINAMRYGSRLRPNPASLGKFGLGMKTASTAFCRKLSVVSCGNGEGLYTKASWDIDHVSYSRKWELAISTPTEEEISFIKAIADNGTGTLVIWEKVDRLLKTYQDPKGNHARKALDKLVEHLKEHAEMVYQRYLDTNDSRAKSIEIFINGEKLKPWDPFLKDISREASKRIELNVTDINNITLGTLIIQAFIIPRKSEYQSDEIRARARITNDNQGLYIYRENRLIYGPGWLRLFSKEPHLSLLRVEFSFDHHLDDAFQIDIKKSQIWLNEDLKKWLTEFLTVPRRAAEQQSRKGERTAIASTSEGAHDSSNENIKSKSPDVVNSSISDINKENGTALITNPSGSSVLKISILEPRRPGEIFVRPMDSIDDGVLWEPCLIDGNQAVGINVGHDFYKKIYVPNHLNNVTIEGLDSLLWSLAAAELETINENTKRHFEEMRVAVSRILRHLVEDLPDPVLDCEK